MLPNAQDPTTSSILKRGYPLSTSYYPYIQYPLGVNIPPPRPIVEAPLW
jgi:hypothetical protein